MGQEIENQILATFFLDKSLISEEFLIGRKHFKFGLALRGFKNNDSRSSNEF